MIVDALLLSVSAFLVWDVVVAYRASTGSVWKRFVAAVKGAAKSAWTGFTVAVTLVVNLLAQAADFVNAPQVATALQTWGKPSFVAALMISAAVILEYARRRSS